MSVDQWIALSNMLLVVVTVAVLIEQGLMDNTMQKIVILLSGGRIRKAVTYSARHSVRAIHQCVECARHFAQNLGRHERPKHEAP